MNPYIQYRIYYNTMFYASKSEDSNNPYMIFNDRHSQKMRTVFKFWFWAYLLSAKKYLLKDIFSSSTCYKMLKNCKCRLWAYHIFNWSLNITLLDEKFKYMFITKIRIKFLGFLNIKCKSKLNSMRPKLCVYD